MSQIEALVAVFAGSALGIAFLVLLIIWAIAWTILPFLVWGIYNRSCNQEIRLTYLVKILGGNKDDLL